MFLQLLYAEFQPNFQNASQCFLPFDTHTGHYASMNFLIPGTDLPDVQESHLNRNWKNQNLINLFFSYMTFSSFKYLQILQGAQGAQGAQTRDNIDDQILIKLKYRFLFEMQKNKLQDYKIIRKIGSGAFGEILEVQVNNSGHIQKYAMKKLQQKQLIKLDKIHEAFIQRQILFKLNKISPDCFVTLHEAHKDNQFIYLILELCEGGGLDNYIADLQNLGNKDQVIKKIVVKMVLALQDLHLNKVIHRDLKPSNFLFKKDGTLKLADFGTAYANEDFFPPEIASTIKEFKEMAKKKKKQKMGQEEQAVENIQMRRATFVGTPLYMAPQLLAQDFCGPEADLWALGCIIYELIHSKPPFYDENEGMVWKKILNEDLNKQQTKSGQKSGSHVESLIKSLLVKDRMSRLGYGEKGYQQILNHPFFEGINWSEERNKPIKEIIELIKSEKKHSIEQKSVQREERVIFSGVVNKQMFFGFKERMLTLLSTPKLVYFDMQSGQKKGEIILQKQTPIGTKGNKTFTVTNSKKTYVFKSLKAHEWVQMIKTAIVSAYY